MEIWKKVVDLEDYYEVSDLGNVRSLQRKGETLYGKRTYGGNGNLKQIISSSGYPCVNLTYKGFRKQFTVHKLVLETFVGKAPKGMECCHNNGLKTDARLLNLRWDTRKNNHLDKKLHGTWQCGEKIGNSKLKEKEALEIKQSKLTTKELAKKFNISISTIEAIKNNISWKHLNAN